MRSVSASLVLPVVTTASLSDWVSGARPRTLPAAVAPVIVGACAAAAFDAFSLGRTALAMVVALALQVGVNYANDYSDGIRGTDANRVGPLRLVGSGRAKPKLVRNAAFTCFGVAVLAGAVLVIASRTWFLFIVGAAMVAAAWFYTGGKRPYGYSGFGEVAVFICFGIIPVLGTCYTQAKQVDGTTTALAVATGLLSSALLVANNLRDIPTDRIAGKLTLAVRLGDHSTRLLYAGMLAGAFALIVPVAARHPWAWLAVLALPLAIAPIRQVLDGSTGRQLVPVLAGTTRLELAYALLIGLGLVLSAA